jgi:co-chaperonin GroES (HSP10)
MIQKSKYLEAFRANAALTDKLLTGGLMIVEVIPQAEIKTSSGIILAQTDRQVNSVKANLPSFVRVLAVGPGYYDEETGETTPPEVRPGQIIMVAESSVKWWSHLPLTGYRPMELGLSEESEAQIRFDSDESFVGFFSALNSNLGAPSAG